MGANTSRCSTKTPSATRATGPPPVPDKDEPRGSNTGQHPPTYEEATFGPPDSDSAVQGANELERHPTVSSVSTVESAQTSTTAAIEMKKMTAYQKEAYRTQRKAEKQLAKAQRRAEKAQRKAEKTEQKFTKRADKLSVKANKSAEKAHTKAMKSADKAHMKAVKMTAKAQKKADIATARANAKMRAAQATAQIASARIGMKDSSPSVTTPPLVMRTPSDRSHSSPIAGPMRPRRVTTVESSTPSRPPSREPDTQRSHSYAGPVPQPSPSAEHAERAENIPRAITSAPQLPELFLSEKEQHYRKTELENEYAQLEQDRVQLDRDILSRQITDLYAGIGKLQMDSQRDREP